MKSLLMRAPLASSLLCACLVQPVFAQTAAIQGAGSSLAGPIYERLGASYARPDFLTYKKVGSGSGVQLLKEGKVDFAGIDHGYSSPELERQGLQQFPVAAGAIVPVTSIPGIAPNSLRLNGSLLSGIYLGVITKWNDPQILLLNPTLNLPDMTITPVFRRDSSGSTHAFTTYLSRTSKAWRETHGMVSKMSGVSSVSADGGDGILSALKSVSGAVGYVEYGQALRNGLAIAQLQNALGEYVEPSPSSISAAVERADWTPHLSERRPAFNVDVILVGAKAAWPIVTLTYVVFPSSKSGTKRTAELLGFCSWIFQNGDTALAELGYTPLPQRTRDYVRLFVWKRIVGRQLPVA